MVKKLLPRICGKVEIHVQYTNNSKQTKTIQGKKETIYTPFVMVTAMILSNDNFSNVEIDNGRVINEGSNNIVVGIGMPGLADSLNLDKDFSDKIISTVKEIAELETEKVQIEELLCSGTLSVDELTEKSKRLPEVNDLIDEKTMRWLELSEIEG